MHHGILGSNDPTALIGVTVSLATVAMGTVGVLARRFLRNTSAQYTALVQPAYDRVKAVEAEKAKVERDKELLIRLLRANKIDVPQEVL